MRPSCYAKNKLDLDPLWNMLRKQRHYMKWLGDERSKGSRHILAFDFSKAYDRVPPEALLYKLQELGIQGKLLSITKALYAKPTLCVRVGNTVIIDVPYMCGVRQGCPSSPILFNIFFNDLLNQMSGIAIPNIT
jgi:hypothetical protein